MLKRSMNSMNRLLFWIISRPLSSFLSYLVLMTAFVLSAGKSGFAGLLLFSLPWLIIPLFLFNLPFIAAILRFFRMCDATKRNHAVEHGTIHFINKNYGSDLRVSGRAEYDGFRISGIKSQDDVREAFQQMAECYARGNRNDMISISRDCGSNVVTAQGFGFALLTITGLTVILFNFNTTVSLILLSLNVIIYFLIRRWLGNLIQERFYILQDFKTVKIERIQPVPKKYFEDGCAYFVETKFT